MRVKSFYGVTEIMKSVKSLASIKLGIECSRRTKCTRRDFANSRKRQKGGMTYIPSRENERDRALKKYNNGERDGCNNGGYWRQS